jgi:succinate dehydrogenase/fumarate reductase cytochrome b subunit
MSPLKVGDTTVYKGKSGQWSFVAHRTTGILVFFFLLLHIVDVAHIPAIHLEHPDWFMVADNWPAWTAVTRAALFDRAADENLLVATYHFPFPGIGRVTKDKIGWAWTPEG